MGHHFLPRQRLHIHALLEMVERLPVLMHTLRHVNWLVVGERVVAQQLAVIVGVRFRSVAEVLRRQIVLLVVVADRARWHKLL